MVSPNSKAILEKDRLQTLLDALRVKGFRILGPTVRDEAIAKRVLSAVLDQATAERASRVVAVRGRAAESEKLPNESLAFHFAAHVLGTIAEGATLEMEITMVRVLCDACGTTYVPEHHVRICTRCNSSDGRLTGEEGVWIEGIDVR